MDEHDAKPRATPCFWLHDLDELRRVSAPLEGLRNAVDGVYRPPPGRHKGLTRFILTLPARLLALYTPTLLELNASVSRSLEEIVRAIEHLNMDMLAIDHLSLNMVALEGRLAQLEKRSATLTESIEQQVDLLRAQVKALTTLQKTANSEAPAGSMETGLAKRSPESSRFYIDTGVGIARTAYVIGLFGTGRLYINDLIAQNIGERARYFRDTIRLHPGPTPMIYSGHVTIKHVSRAQCPPEVMTHILDAVRSGFADVLFIYRHPLDSLLTNWIYWRTHIRENRGISGISEIYKNTDDLCGVLDRNFLEFKAFAEGNPEFFAASPGSRFLSFSEFVEETELHLQSATLGVRLEDCIIDPRKEFFRIAEAMSVDPDSSLLSIAPPRTKPYGHLAVREKVPRFRSFIDGLNAETRQRIEKIGYDLTA
jgi:hypothetical protein